MKTTQKRFVHAKSEFKNINFKFHTHSVNEEKKVSKTSEQNEYAQLRLLL